MRTAAPRSHSHVEMTADVVECTQRRDRIPRARDRRSGNRIRLVRSPPPLAPTALWKATVRRARTPRPAAPSTPAPRRARTPAPAATPSAPRAGPRDVPLAQAGLALGALVVASVALLGMAVAAPRA